jgi:hypothetical protein
MMNFYLAYIRYLLYAKYQATSFVAAKTSCEQFTSKLLYYYFMIMIYHVLWHWLSTLFSHNFTAIMPCSGEYCTADEDTQFSAVP